MNTKTLCMIVLAGSLIVPSLYAGTEIIEKQTMIRERMPQAIPYGEHTGLPLIDDDEIKSPWSSYVVASSGDLGPGQVLYDPVVGRHFMVPEDW